jgi:hypothetical protein
MRQRKPRTVHVHVRRRNGHRALAVATAASMVGLAWVSGPVAPLEPLLLAVVSHPVPSEHAPAPGTSSLTTTSATELVPGTTTTSPPGTTASSPTSEVRVLPARYPDPGIPTRVLQAYQLAAQATAASDPACALPWWLLAGIGRIESGHASGGRVDADGRTRGRILGPLLDGSLVGTRVITDSDSGSMDGNAAYDRAVGPMQFLPGTWRGWGADADGDGRADPHDVDDAALAAARYLCAGAADLSTETGMTRAVLRYNASDTYVASVLSWGRAYRDGVVPVPGREGTVPPPATHTRPPTSSTSSAPPPASTTTSWSSTPPAPSPTGSTEVPPPTTVPSSPTTSLPGSGTTGPPTSTDTTTTPAPTDTTTAPAPTETTTAPAPTDTTTAPAPTETTTAPAPTETTPPPTGTPPPTEPTCPPASPDPTAPTPAPTDPTTGQPLPPPESCPPDPTATTPPPAEPVPAPTATLTATE